MSIDFPVIQVSSTNLSAYWDAITSTDYSLESAAAKITILAFPIIALACFLMDICATRQQQEQIKKKYSFAPLENLGDSKKSVVVDLIKVALQGTDQGNSSDAALFCDFKAAKMISVLFDGFVDCLMLENGEKLSTLQKKMIGYGLESYEDAVKKKRDGGDPDSIEKFLPRGMKMGKIEKDVVFVGSDPAPEWDFDEVLAMAEKGRTMEEMAFANDENLNAIVDHLFAPVQGKTKIVWIKNPDQKSFVLIAKEDRVILSDMHQNEMSLLFSRGQVQRILREKIGIYPNVNFYDYSLGTSPDNICQKITFTFQGKPFTFSANPLRLNN